MSTVESVEGSVRLTRLAKRAGCAAKHSPAFLLPLLGKIAGLADPNVLIGSNTVDDAAVYRVSDELALIFTCDFFTPIVDRPYDFGAIAAANALSDVYAMRGEPLMALNLVGFPEQLPVEVLQEILSGASDTAARAGIAIVGGHTIKSEEPIFGLAVVGRAHPQRVVSNAGALSGDALVLTKPLGVGIITTAAKNDEDVLGAISVAAQCMATLNRDAAEVLQEFDVHAMTDVTGYGMLGHLRNMTSASGLSAEVWLDCIPAIPEAVQYIRSGIAPGGTHANWKFLSDWVVYDSQIDKPDQLLLCDAQTSGGLLIATPAQTAEELVEALQRRGVTAAAVVGQIVTPDPEAGLAVGQISVRRNRQ